MRKLFWRWWTMRRAKTILEIGKADIIVVSIPEEMCSTSVRLQIMDEFSHFVPNKVMVVPDTFKLSLIREKVYAES